MLKNLKRIKLTDLDFQLETNRDFHGQTKFEDSKGNAYYIYCGRISNCYVLAESEKPLFDLFIKKDRKSLEKVCNIIRVYETNYLREKDFSPFCEYRDAAIATFNIFNNGADTQDEDEMFMTSVNRTLLSLDRRCIR
ncbi:MAG: hypothetical protein K6F82_01920 [Sphaerochaetaceae bacterium]|nr:hypothetical protein [Sphaerochaetaceae bacterium]